MKFNKLIFFNLIVFCYLKPQAISIGGNLQLGDNIAELCLAKILSVKYNIPFYFKKFKNYEIFLFSEIEKELIHDIYLSHPIKVRVRTEKDILKNIKNKNVLFYTDVKTQIKYIHPKWISKLKYILKLKQAFPLKQINSKFITVAVHIRKGNGGGWHYDGEQSSLQLFDYNKSIVKYINGFKNYPFDYSLYQRVGNNILYLPNKLSSVDKTWGTKFPPDQFYIDQIKKLYLDLNKPKLFVQIFTDDKNPLGLINRIKKALNIPNIIIYFEDNAGYDHKEKIAKDLYQMSKFDVLIRSQSYFSRIAEIIGRHKVVICPLTYVWKGKKLIMNKVIVKGSIKNLKK